MRATRMISGVAAGIGLVAAAAMVDAQQAPSAVQRPPFAPATDRTPGARVTVADYRFGDLLWENDRTAHRIYGRPLEAAEPPSGSGLDAWGKAVAWPFMDRQLRTGDQHTDHGEGLDFYNVGAGRGAGGLGIWFDNKLWTSRNYVRFRRHGGDLAKADFSVDYAPWPVGVDRRVWETRRFTLPMGTHFTRMASVLQSNSPDALIVGIGIGKRTTGQDAGEMTVDRSRGVLSWWGPEDGTHGRMAIALRVDPAQIEEVRQDADNHLVLLRVTPGRPLIYYTGAAWSGGQGGFRTRATWDRYASGQVLTFR